MAKGDAEKFIDKVRKDEDFRLKLAAASGKGERMKIARDAGFDFTPDELKFALDNLVSDEQLDSVSGGWMCGYTHEGSDAPVCHEDCKWLCEAGDMSPLMGTF